MFVATLPPWLIAAFVGVLGAALAGAAGANAFMAVLAAGVSGFVGWRVLRDPPWTSLGRRRWRQMLAGWLWRLRRMLARVSWSRASESAWRRDVDLTGAPPPHAVVAPPDVPAGGRVPVRCEVATERLQVWHSMTTSRAYEVPVDRGIAGAQPGAVADLVFERGRARVVQRDVN